jgi:CBS domain-containing protein
MSEILVENIMTEKVTVAGLQHTFSQVLEFFNKFDINHIPVMKDDKIIGIISETDVMKHLSDRLLAGETFNLEQLNEKISIEHLMTPSPVTIVPETTLEEALQLIYSDGFHALPVLDKSGALRGIVSSNDLLHTFYREMRPPSYDISSPGFGI